MSNQQPLKITLLTVLTPRRKLPFNRRSAPRYRAVRQSDDQLLKIIGLKKMFNLQNEISRVPPKVAAAMNFELGTPIFTAFGCALLEREIAGNAALGKHFAYTAVNLETGQTELISKQRNPLMFGNEADMAERIRNSRVAGYARNETERMYGKAIRYDKCREILKAVFTKLLPQHGYSIRKEQIALADSMMETIGKRGLSLSEAEVGTGKTHAYLVAAILAKRGRLNDFGNKSLYPNMSYTDMANMPIVIATSSIALQKAIVTDYIPELSDILLEHGVINSPLTAVLRKGREHYVCRLKLQSRLSSEPNKKRRAILKRLSNRISSIDLADADGLDAYTKRKIGVPKRCDKYCPHRNDCLYLRFRSYANNPAIDIQVVNHNYFLADVLRRANGQPPLIPNYQTVIVDEAHKFLTAARSMYGAELSSFTIPEIRDSILKLRFKRGEAEKSARKLSKKLSDESNRLFRQLNEKNTPDDTDDEPTRFTIVIDSDAERHLRNLRNISDLLCELLNSEEVLGNGGSLRLQIVWELGNVREQAAALHRHTVQICWLERPDEHTHKGAAQETKLCAIPKDLNDRLYSDFWSKPIATILTSGTLSSEGDFSHIKRTLGLEKKSHHLSEIQTFSPFDHSGNALLYISETMPFPDNFSENYITAVANEVEKLIIAAHGHTAVLFTGYKVMDKVTEQLIKRRLPFPLFTLNKGGVNEIERFKQSGNGV
jgi:ATP-dependent DNA helicase DinG